MFKLACDRSLFVRIPPDYSVRRIEEQFCCPVRAGAVGEICRIAPSPCRVYVAQPFDTFASIAQKTGLEEQKLQAFNRGIVYPSRKIYLYS